MEGVLMENYGRNGKSDFSKVQGKVWTSAPGTELFQVPLFEQRADFGDRVLHLKAADNTEFTAKPLYSFKVNENRTIDVVFANKHLDTGNDFISSLEDNMLEPRIYDIMKELSRQYTTEEIMADGGSLKFEEKAQALIKAEFEKQGLDMIMFSSNLDFSDKVKEKIDSRNEVNTNISVLDQQIEEQKKRNQLAELEAQESIIRSKALTPQILQQQSIQKWDGKLPATMTGSTQTIMNIPLK